jgi:hypothetical protein
MAMTEQIPARIWAASIVLAALSAAGARAQQQPAPTAQQPAPTVTQGDVFESSGQPVYSDVFETDCEKNNDQNNPYADMNPLECYGFAFGADANNQCTFHGLKVIKQVGSTCYYCQALNPPVKGFIIPMDDLKAAEGQGFICGVDQADPSCKAVCQGNGTFNPPPGTEETPGPPTPTPEVPSETSPPLTLQIAGGSNCSKLRTDSFADVPGANSTFRYQLGFENGFKNCAASLVTLENIAIAAAALEFQEIATFLKLAVAPTAIAAVLEPPGTSNNPDPYLRGTDEGQRFCNWALKVAPAAMAKCPAAQVPALTCNATAMANDLSQVTNNTVANAPPRSDCFPCTMAWLKNETYTVPANGGTGWDLAQIEQFLQAQYGKLIPQGPVLPCWRQIAQQKGIPGSMSSLGIQNEMTLAGDGAAGVVLIRDAGSEAGHAVGVKTQGSGANAKVIFWDEQQGQPADELMQPGAWLGFYRIK